MSSVAAISSRAGELTKGFPWLTSPIRSCSKSSLIKQFIHKSVLLYADQRLLNVVVNNIYWDLQVTTCNWTITTWEIIFRKSHRSRTNSSVEKRSCILLAMAKAREWWSANLRDEGTKYTLVCADLLCTAIPYMVILYTDVQVYKYQYQYPHTPIPILYTDVLAIQCKYQYQYRGR